MQTLLSLRLLCVWANPNLIFPKLNPVKDVLTLSNSGESIKSLANPLIFFHFDEKPEGFEKKSKTLKAASGKRKKSFLSPKVPFVFIPFINPLQSTGYFSG